MQVGPPATGHVSVTSVAPYCAAIEPSPGMRLFTGDGKQKLDQYHPGQGKASRPGYWINRYGPPKVPGGPILAVGFLRLCRRSRGHFFQAQAEDARGGVGAERDPVDGGGGLDGGA